MNRDGCLSFREVCKRLCAAGVVAFLASPACADLTNKYTFNNNTANDSIGGQHGVVVDNTGISRFVGGAFDMSENNGAGSNQDFSNPATVGTFIDLPNGVFTSAVNGGVFGGVSLEIWFTTQQNRGWAEAFVFGTSAAGEDLSTGEGAYVALIPQSGIAVPDFRGTTRDGGGMEVPLIGSPTPLPTGVKQHVVYALDHNDTDGGTKPNGTGRLYLNGAAVGSAEIATFLDTLPDVNNWLGRSQWPDQLYDGAIDEFRIYSHALTAGEVTTSFNTGPDPSPSPTLLVDRDTGMVSVANQTPGSIQLKGYSIMSAAGGLDPAMWVSIDAGNTFDPNGTWTAQSSTSTNLAESVTGGTLDGGSLAASASRAIGTPWRQTPFEDLVFSYTLGDDTTGLGVVQFSGTPLERSDLNGDGQVNAADWAIFVVNAYTNISGETAVGAYLKGDLDGDIDNDYADFLLFKGDFVAANGAAAFAALTGQVPEPSSAVLVMLALSLLGRRVRRTN